MITDRRDLLDSLFAGTITPAQCEAGLDALDAEEETDVFIEYASGGGQTWALRDGAFVAVTRQGAGL